MDLCFCGGETIDDESERENGIPLCSTCSTFNDWTLNGQGERQVEQHLSSDYYKLHLQPPPPGYYSKSLKDSFEHFSISENSAIVPFCHRPILKNILL